ncbi:MAG: hypothetical protein KGL39_52365, partial [Patescibacteria group bacterium]|nr:hypothetical protein [Patescibacteria group bacterium]
EPAEYATNGHLVLPTNQTYIVFLLKSINDFGSSSNALISAFTNVSASIHADGKLLDCIIPYDRTDTNTLDQKAYWAWLRTATNWWDFKCDLERNFDSKTETGDGLHPNQFGAEHIANLVAKSLFAQSLPETNVLTSQRILVNGNGQSPVNWLTLTNSSGAGIVAFADSTTGGDLAAYNGAGDRWQNYFYLHQVTYVCPPSGYMWNNTGPTANLMQLDNSGNLTLYGGIFTGNGSGLTNIPPAAVTNAAGFWAAAPSGGGGSSTLGSAITGSNGAPASWMLGMDAGGLLTTNAVPTGGGGTSALPVSTNSVWNLTNSANNFSGNGAGLTNLNPGAVAGIVTNYAPTQVLQSVATNESGVIGPENLSATGWTSNGWTGSFSAGWKNNPTNGLPLIYPFSGAAGNLYQIGFTVTGATGGSFTIAMGGNTNSGVSTTGNLYPINTSSAGYFTVTPTTNFDGTVIFSVKLISASYPTWKINDSTQTSAFEIRNTLSGLFNSYIGPNAGSHNTTGFNNSAQGANALNNNTTGNNNSAQGANALRYNTTGNYNSAQGGGALYYNTTGFYNSAQGGGALYYNTTGFNNSAQGANALNNNTTGSYNSAQGANALQNNTTGSYNSAQGRSALYNNTTGFNNSAQGANALQNNTIGSYNSAQGVNALQNNTIGSYNSAQGVNALQNNTNNANDIAIGYQAGTGLSENNANNIDIGSAGMAGDAGIIRIGTPGTHLATYLSGIVNGNGVGLTNLLNTIPMITNSSSPAWISGMQSNTIYLWQSNNPSLSGVPQAFKTYFDVNTNAVTAVSGL